MDIRKLKKLIELVEDSGIAELEITEGEESVRIGRYPPASSQPAGASQPASEPASSRARHPAASQPASQFQLLM